MKKYLFALLFLCGSFHQSLLGLPSDVLKRFEVRAGQSNTDSLLVLKNCRSIFNYHAGRHFSRFDCKEMTRPILALAFAFLYDERFITNLDALALTYCPPEESGIPPSLTLRSLLSDDGCDFYALGTLVKAITGQAWHDYIQIKLFNPLGICRTSWEVSENDSVRLLLTAPDLAKIGALIAGNGMWKGEQLVSRDWIAKLYAPSDVYSPFMSMQWHVEYFDLASFWDEELIRLYESRGVSSFVTGLLKCLNGRVVHFGGLAISGRLIHGWGHDIFCSLGGQEGFSRLILETHAKNVPLGRFKTGRIKSLVAWGAGGQQLIIMPGYNLVGVRQTKDLGCRDTFEDFVEVLDDYQKDIACYEGA